ncbi:MAG: response regulator transcription factor [Candidatus Didemnitutus sp.]|nr:response regulator transcription factor [Candidatus Didemnitutus sp.]
MSFTFVMVSRATLWRQLLRDKIESDLSARCLADCGHFDELRVDLESVDLAIFDADDGIGPAIALGHALTPARSIRHCCFLTSTRGSFLAYHLFQDEKLRGIVHTADTVAEVLRAIGDIANGAHRLSSRIDQRERRYFGALLSPRETELAEAFAYGASNEVLAARFGLSPETVRTHRRNLFRKLDAHNQTDLIRFALGSGLVATREFVDGGRHP